MRIKSLTTDLVKQIAAGEVVFSPAQVLKELVENAIDAGATRIDVLIEDFGKQLIQVKDNGCGIHKDDLPKAILHHATSKILKTDDLHAIQTLGFRGEALSSIAGVSRFKLASRCVGDEVGYQLACEQSDLSPIVPVKMQIGTLISCYDLFYNTPARLKFLKSDRTELAHCWQILKSYAICHHQIHFSWQHNDQSQTNIKSVESLDEARISQILPQEIVNRMQHATFNHHDIQVVGWLADPSDARHRSDMQYVYINQRLIKSKEISQSIKKAYGDLLHGPVFPVVILCITMPFDQVDVNVHPTKTEVRFAKPQAVFQAVYHLIQSSLQQHKPSLSHQWSIDDRPTVSNKSIEDTLWQPVTSQVELIQPVTNQSVLPNQQAEPDSMSPEAFRNTQKPVEEPIAQGDIDQVDHTDKKRSDRAVNFEVQPLGKAIGQLHDIYILAQNDQGLMIVDMHAAHERILYEQLKKSHSQSQLLKQTLLIPARVKLSPDDYQLLKQYQDRLEEFGIDTQAITEQEILIRAVPALIKDCDPESLLFRLLDELKSCDAQSLQQSEIYHILSSRACKSAVKANRSLSLIEMNALLRQIEKTQHSEYCNHGRPTFYQFDVKTLDKLFHRGQ
jgi:DNA mismatch repair protein MutL